MKRSTKALKKLVGKLAPAVALRTVVELAEDGVRLVSPGADLTITVSTGNLEGAAKPVAVDASHFGAAVAKLGGEVTMNLVAGVLMISSEKAVFELATIKPMSTNTKLTGEELRFPLLPFREAMMFAATAANGKEKFGCAGSIQVSSFPDRIRAAGSDMQRLAIAEQLGVYNTFPDLILPLALVDATYIFDPEKGDSPDVVVRFSENVVSMESAYEGTVVEITCRKFARTFVPFDHLLPTAAGFQCRVKAEEFAEALSRVSALVKKDQSRRVTLSFDQGTLRLQTTESNNKATDEIACVIESAVKSFTVALNHKHLLDFAGAVDGDVVVIANAATQPIVLSAQESTRRLLTTALG